MSEVHTEVLGTENPKDDIQEKINEISTVTTSIKSGLQSFKERKTELEELSKEADGLKIESIEDKDKIEQVSTIRKKLKKARVQIEKEVKALRAPINAFNSFISEKGNELLGIITPIEEDLQKQEDWVEAEYQKIEQEKEKAKKARIQGMIDKLQEYGSEIEIEYLEGLSDDGFQVVLNRAKLEWEKEQEKLAEEQKEKEKERLKLEAEKKELEELRLKQAEAQRIIDENNRKQREEQERIENEKRELIRKRTTNRKQQLMQLGFAPDIISSSYYYDEIEVTAESIEEGVDEHWEAIIQKHIPAIKEKKKLQEEKAEQAREQLRKDAAAKALREQKEKQEREKQEQEERLAQSSDAIKFQVVIENLQSTLLNFPTMKSKKSQRLADDIKSRIKGMVADVQTSIASKSQKVA